MWISTLPPLWQVIGKTRQARAPLRLGIGIEGRRSRGRPSSSALRASAVTVGRVQLPPTQPWKRRRA